MLVGCTATGERVSLEEGYGGARGGWLRLCVVLVALFVVVGPDRFR